MKWKLRGNEKIEIDGVLIQLSWDVYNWLFDYVMEGHTEFMFRFEKSGFEKEDDDLYHHYQSTTHLKGMGLCGFGDERNQEEEDEGEYVENYPKLVIIFSIVGVV